MKTKEDSFFLEHMLESIENIREFTKTIQKEEFFKNKEKQSAVIRQIEILGEAAKNLSEKTIFENPLIPWKELIGARDKIIHHYFGVDLEIIWEIIKTNLPDLETKLIPIIEKMKKAKAQELKV